MVKNLFPVRKPTHTPQTIPLRGMVANNAGGYAYEANKWDRVLRFLILGTDNGTYYVDEQKLTAQNVDVIRACLDEDGPRLVSVLVDVSVNGRAPRQDPTLLALAMAASHQNAATRRAALDSLKDICRIPTHLFAFLHYVSHMRGWGRGLRQAVARWYLTYEADTLAYHVAKYRNRYGWTHGDALRVAHPKTKSAAFNAIFQWVLGKEGGGDDYLRAFDRLQETENEAEVIKLVQVWHFTHDMLPTQWKRNPAIWRALLPTMPMTALIRNLGVLTNLEVIKRGAEEVKTISQRIVDPKQLHKARVHPLALLGALGVYSQGHGERGSLSWQPAPDITDALSEAFHRAFANVEATGKRLLIAVDVSGSMHSGTVAGMPGIAPYQGAAAMALLFKATETKADIVAFDTGLYPLPLDPRARLNEVMAHIASRWGGGTNCALPIEWALQESREYDGFVILTDSETWAGQRHAVQALTEYRRRINHAARMVVVSMEANSATVGDPNDQLTLQMVGLDANANLVLAQFLSGVV